jgi:peptidoglycan/LPS O-acetylase OafA/YrhL
MTACVLWRRYIRDLDLSNAVWTVIEAIMLILVVLWLWQWFSAINARLAGDDYLQQALKLSGSSWIFAALIVGFASGRGLIGRALSTKVPVFLGHVSFAIYMVHQVLMKAAITWLPKEDIHTLPYMAILLILATALHLCVEKPCQNWLTRTKEASKSRRLSPAD